MGKVYLISQKGLTKDTNEDSLHFNGMLFKDGYNEINFDVFKSVCLCDGVGGNGGGSMASEYVCNNLLSIDCISDLTSAVQKLNEKLIAYSETTLHKTMATTLSGIINKNDFFQAFHIGNTRIYHFQAMYLVQDTKDHTTYELMNKQDGINRSEIYACMGGGSNNYFEGFTVIDLNQIYKRYLLTTDGIHEYVKDNVMEEIFEENISIKEKLEKIVREAVNNGSKDDLSIIYLDLREEKI